jgi:hypothetical protein
MGFIKSTRCLDFADLAMANCLEQNRSIKLMEQLNNTINWACVESILLSHYTLGTSEEGARAYPPLMLFKCLMLQKWFRIPFDPSWKTKSPTGCPSRPFWGFHSADLLWINTPSPVSAAGCPSRPWMRSIPRSCASSEQQGLSINEGRDFTTAKFTELEILRNKAISKIRYIIEQYIGISHLTRPRQTGKVYKHHQKQVRRIVTAGGLQRSQRYENPLSGSGVSRGLFLTLLPVDARIPKYPLLGVSEDILSSIAKHETLITIKNSSQILKSRLNPVFQTSQGMSRIKG